MASMGAGYGSVTERVLAAIAGVDESSACEVRSRGRPSSRAIRRASDGFGAPQNRRAVRNEQYLPS